MDFDKSEVKEVKRQLGGKLSKKNRLRLVGLNPTLQTVEENEDEHNETTFRNNESEIESKDNKLLGSVCQQDDQEDEKEGQEESKEDEEKENSKD